MNIQFCALPEEIFSFVKRWSQKFNFYVFKVKLFPFIVSQIPSIDEMEQSISELKEIDFIYLGLSPPNLSAISNYDFIGQNPNYLSIYLGKLNDEGLGESALGGITSNPEELKIWKKIARDIKKETFTGMWAINPLTNNKAFYKNARYSKGAFELAEKGKKLFQIGGGVYYEIDKS